MSLIELSWTAKKVTLVELNVQISLCIYDLGVSVLSCKPSGNATAIVFHFSQEHLCLAFLFAINLTFFLAIWQLIEAGLASHLLQHGHGVGTRTESCVFCKSVDVHFEGFLVISGSFDISGFDWIGVWIQKKD